RGRRGPRARCGGRVNCRGCRGGTERPRSSARRRGLVRRSRGWRRARRKRPSPAPPGTRRAGAATIREGSAFGTVLRAMPTALGGHGWASLNGFAWPRKAVAMAPIIPRFITSSRLLGFHDRHLAEQFGYHVGDALAFDLRLGPQ